MKSFQSKNGNNISDAKHLVEAKRTYTGGRFALEINGKIVSGIQVDEIESESTIIDSEPGPIKINRVKLRKDWSGASEFFKWRKAVLDGKVDRRSMSVIFHNDAGEEAGRYTFHECWPVRYRVTDFGAKNSGHAIEKIEISFETMELKAA